MMNQPCSCHNALCHMLDTLPCCRTAELVCSRHEHENGLWQFLSSKQTPYCRLGMDISCTYPSGSTGAHLEMVTMRRNLVLGPCDDVTSVDHDQRKCTCAYRQLCKLRHTPRTRRRTTRCITPMLTVFAQTIIRTIDGFHDLQTK